MLSSTALALTRRQDFSDPHVIIREDRVIEGEEPAIGYVDRVLVVVHTVREQARRDYTHHFSPQSDACGKEVV